MRPIRPEIGDVAMPLSCFEKRDHARPGALVVAGAWLIAYGVLFGGFAFTQVFASQ